MLALQNSQHVRIRCSTLSSLFIAPSVIEYNFVINDVDIISVKDNNTIVIFYTT